MPEAVHNLPKLKMHAIVSFLDRKNDRTVRSLSKELEKTLGVQAPDPHITYQGATDYNFAKLENRLKRFSRRSRRFRVPAGGVALFSGFTPTLYIPVVRTPELSKFHLSLWRTISSAASGISPHYKTEFWVPHITLARDIDHRKIPKVISWLSRTDLELDIIVDNLGLIVYDGETHHPRSKFGLGKGLASYGTRPSP
jgi:2'-5' RNA ligase